MTQVTAFRPVLGQHEVMTRQKSLVFPREHGAWGILLIPLITGATAGLLGGGHARMLLPFVIAVLAVFWLRTPVESWLGAAAIKARSPEEFRLVRRTALALTGVAALESIWLFWGPGNIGLVWIGAGAGAAFCLQALVKHADRDNREAAQMIGAAGLTAVAPAAWYVVTGAVSVAAWALWLANFLFAVNQIQFVQLRIRAARMGGYGERLAAGRGFLLGQAVLSLVLVLAGIWRLLPWYVAAAFVPVLWRGFAWFGARPAPLDVHALGKRELLYASIFGVLLVAGQACSPVLR